jgi:small neutral amino acid transporter SnatA (MarC family)
MDTKTIDFYLVVELFLLLLIGIGPKIALVPFLDVTAGMDGATKGLVIRKMLTTASVVAVILVVFGELLTRLLHFSTGALAVAGGIVLLIIAVSMVLGLGDGTKAETSVTDKEQPMRLAVYPLAIP